MNKKWFVAIMLLVMTYGLHAQQVFIKDTTERPQQDSVTKYPGALSFLVIGDWGRNGADYQKPVADQMGKTATAIIPQFIVSAGDNFYPSGVISDRDPLFFYSFENIYTDFSLQWDWYCILGNHDYKSNPDAQVAYSKVSRRWKMPSRYFAKKFLIDGDTSQQVLIAFIDTNPLIPQFYNNAEYGPNVKTQDSTAQKKWLETLLAENSPNVKWKIVVGHHPMYTGGSRTDGYDTKAIRSTLQPMFEKYGVDAYISGHEHSLQYMKPQGLKTHHFVSGSASERTAVKLIEVSKFSASEYGFMLFSVSAKELWMQAIDYKGKMLYKTSIKK